MEVNFEYELIRGDEVVTIDVDAIVITSHDPNYGSDADGNRGEPRTFVEDVILDTGSIVLTDAEYIIISDRAVEVALW